MTQVEEALSLLYKKHINAAAKVNVIWLTFEAGQAFVEYQESSVPTVMAPVNEHLSEDIRAPFLYELLDIWCSISGCERDKVVLTAPDQSLADAFLTMNEERIAKPVRWWEMLKFYARLVSAKIKRGHLITSTNF
jgi:hypothetical protein